MVAGNGQHFETAVTRDRAAGPSQGFGRLFDKPERCDLMAIIAFQSVEICLAISRHHHTPEVRRELAHVMKRHTEQR